MSLDFVSLNLDARERENAESFGIKFPPGGVHQSRTMMLSEISTLMRLGSPKHSSIDDYRIAVIERNLLGKKTDSTRHKTFSHLRELYLLSDAQCLFRAYRHLMVFDPASAPLLSLLAAWSRDPVLRASTEAVLDARAGSEVPNGRFQAVLEQAFPGKFSDATLHSTSQNVASTWTQSGHLSGRERKMRQIVQPQPASVTFALYLARAIGIDGEQLFSSFWCRLIDLSSSQARELAARAHREGLLRLKAISSTVEVAFPAFDHSPGRSQ